MYSVGLFISRVEDPGSPPVTSLDSLGLFASQFLDVSLLGLHFVELDLLSF